jgi:hypothetical protein
VSTTKISTAVKSPWISARAAARMGVPRQHLPSLARAGIFRCWRLPLDGVQPRYNRDDIERLLPGATTPAPEGGAP